MPDGSSDGRWNSSLDIERQLDAICAKFERAWQGDGDPPSIEDFLPGDSELRPVSLIELIAIDLERRLLGGDEVELEAYLKRFPELAEDERGVVDLIGLDYLKRRRLNLDVSVDDYQQRFPQFADAIAASLKRMTPEPKARFPLRLNCPHCHNPIAIVDDGSGDAVTCPSCGSGFHVDGKDQSSWSPEKLPQLGKFRLIEELGRGAFGTVYRAQDTELDRVVAVKVPRSGSFSSSDDEERFFREARNAARLTHPGIVPVFEVGRSELCPFIVTEFVQGVTLDDALTAQRLDGHEAASLIAELADAVDHAHQNGVVHRDIKPSNIILESAAADRDSRGSSSIRSGRDSSVSDSSNRSTSSKSDSSRSEGARWRPRLMDFGLARRDAAEVTVTVEGQILGTPAYMSPEQALGEGHQADGRADIYALGAVLFELLTGELPFRGSTRMLLHQVIHDDPPPLRRLDSNVPRDLETICLKCLEKSPDRRYPSAGELAGELRRFLNGTPIEARPISRTERLWRWCRRRPKDAIMALVVSLLIMFFVAWAADQRARSGRAADLALERLLSVDFRSLSVVLDETQPAIPPERVRKELLEAENEADRLRLNLTLLRSDVTALPDVRRHLIECSLEEFPVLLHELRPHLEELQPWLQEKLRDEAAEKDSARLLAALALVAMDEGPESWTDQDLYFIAQELASADWDDQAELRRHLQGIGRPLLKPLREIMADESKTETDRLAALRAATELASTKPLELIPFIASVRISALNLEVLGNALRPGFSQAEFSTELLAALDDPKFTSRLPAIATDLGIPALTIVNFLDRPLNDRQKRATLQTLSTFDPETVSLVERDIVLQHVRPLVEEASSGVQQDADRLLRVWGLSFPTRHDETVPFDPTGKRDWFVEGVTEHPMRFVVFPPGEFQMGLKGHETFNSHRVRFTRPFAIASHELTRRQFERYLQSSRTMGTARSYVDAVKQWSPTDRHPAIGVTWNDAVKYCNWLTLAAGMSEEDLCYADVTEKTQKGGLPTLEFKFHLERFGYRLPTEAEWEYACRAGTETLYHFGDDESLAERYAWLMSNSELKLQEVGLLLPNPKGLFDMYGNVWEWCYDGMTPRTPYPSGLAIDPEGDDDGPVKAVRGGSAVNSDHRHCRSAARSFGSATDRTFFIGFRVARTLPVSNADSRQE